MNIKLFLFIFLSLGMNTLSARCSRCTDNYTHDHSHLTVTTHFPSSYYSDLNNHHIFSSFSDYTDYSYSCYDYTDYTDGSCGCFDDSLSSFSDFTSELASDIRRVDTDFNDFTDVQEEVDEAVDQFILDREFLCSNPRKWLRKVVRAYNDGKYKKCLRYLSIYKLTLLNRGWLPYCVGKINCHQRATIRFYKHACKHMLDSTTDCSDSSYSWSDWTDSSYCTDSLDFSSSSECSSSYSWSNDYTDSSDYSSFSSDYTDSSRCRYTDTTNTNCTDSFTLLTRAIDSSNLDLSNLSAIYWKLAINYYEIGDSEKSLKMLNKLVEVRSKAADEITKQEQVNILFGLIESNHKND